MKKTLLSFGLIFLAVLASPNSHALEEINRTYRGVRSLGMGGVVTTTGVYDEALFNNPATALEAEAWKISIINVTAEVNDNVLTDRSTVLDAAKTSGSEIITTLNKLIGRNEHVRATVLPGFYSPKLFGEDTGFAFGILANVRTNLMLRSTLDLDNQTFADIGPAIGLAHRFLDKTLTLGVNVRGIYRLGSDSSLRATSFLEGSKLSISNFAGQGFGVDGDIGAFYRFKQDFWGFRPSLGLSVNNVVKSTYRIAGQEVIKAITTSPPANDRTVAVGARIDTPDLFIFSKTKLAVEMQNLGNLSVQASTYKRIHLGLETNLTRFFALRGGVNQGYWTAGLGIDLPILKLDFASYGEEIGANTGQIEDRRYVARICIDI